MYTRQYKYVMAVAELKNFGLAADQCCVTQSTLSTMIGKFEAELGIKIFDRKTKPITITKEGEQVIGQLKVIEKEIFNLNELVQSIKGELVGELKIGIIPTVAPYLLPKFLSDFANKFPNINFLVSEMTTKSIIELLEKRELDLGIIAMPTDHKTLVEVPLYNEPFVLYDCSGKPKKEVNSLENIDYSNFWLLEEEHCLHTHVSTLCDLYFNKSEVDVNFNFRAGSIESLVRFVKANHGVTLLPYLACLEYSQEESDKLSYFKAPVPVRTIGFMYHPHFAKRHLLEQLKVDIQKRINPLIKVDSKQFVVAP